MAETIPRPEEFGIRVDELSLVQRLRLARAEAGAGLGLGPQSDDLTRLASVYTQFAQRIGATVPQKVEV